MSTIRIAAALMTDPSGRMLVVRKRGTAMFMQPGGKIDAGETPAQALARELREEVGMDVPASVPSYLGRFSAPAAFEANTTVEADIFHVSASGEPSPAAEIEEIAWIGADERHGLPLAQLTRECVLPLLLLIRPAA